MTKKICRSAVALAAFCTCLTLMSPPAAANWIYSFAGHAGNLKVVGAGNATLNIPIINTTENGCYSTGMLTERSNVNPKTLELTPFTFRSRFQFNNAHYVATVTKVALSSNPSNIPASLTSEHVTNNVGFTLSVEIKDAANPNDSTCDTNGNVRCSWTAVHKIGLAWTDSMPLTVERVLDVSNPDGPAALANQQGCGGAFAPFTPTASEQFDTAKFRITARKEANIKKGGLTFNKTGMTPEVLTLDPLAAGNCNDGTLGLAITGTSISGTSLASSGVRTFGTTGTFLMVFTRSTAGNTAGTLNTTVTPHTVTSMRVATVMTVYNTTGCTPTGTPICTLAVLLNLSGTLTGTTSGSEFDFTGSSVGNVAANPTCTTGPSYLIGSTVTVTDSIAGDL